MQATNTKAIRGSRGVKHFVQKKDQKHPFFITTIFTPVSQIQANYTNIWLLEITFAQILKSKNGLQSIKLNVIASRRVEANISSEKRLFMKSSQQIL